MHILIFLDLKPARDGRAEQVRETLRGLFTYCTILLIKVYCITTGSIDLPAQVDNRNSPILKFTDIHRKLIYSVLQSQRLSLITAQLFQV